jgi:hypothetical protein
MLLYQIPSLDSLLLLASIVLVDHGDGGLVVLVKDRWAGLGKTEIRKDGAKVLGSFGSRDGGDELGFGRGRRDSSLQFGLVRTSRTSKAKNQAGDRTTGLEISSMSRVHVSNKLEQIVLGKRRKRVVKQRMIQGVVWKFGNG